MNYIVFDLEWNQSDTGKEPQVKEMPFEIIDLGAILLNQERVMISEFNQLIKPQVYLKMHFMTSKIIHLHMKDLQKGKPFTQVMKEFIQWCGEDFIFCSWGPLDLWELQRNMKFYDMKPFCQGPMKFLDIQKLFSINFEDGKSRRSLEYAIDMLKISKDIPFHRAFSDAYYTAKVMAEMDESVFLHYSFDTFYLPKTREEEIHVVFPEYSKYISREFVDKQAALADREVISTKCYLCSNGRNLRRKVKWFTPNGKHFYSISFCPEHGYMKSKIRIKKIEDERVYVIKTNKLINQKEYENILQKRETAREHKRFKKIKTGSPYTEN